MKVISKAALVTCGLKTFINSLVECYWDWSGLFRRDEQGDAAMVDKNLQTELDLATFEDFLKLDIRCGTIVEATLFPEARKPAYKMVIDFGPKIGQKKSSAQIPSLYTPEMLVGRQVMAVVNFPPRQIGPLMSEVLTLGVSDEAGAIVLVVPDQPTPDGCRLQ